MDFSWGGLFGFFRVAAVFVFIKNFFEKKEKERFFSYRMVIEILILMILFQASTWFLSQI